MIHGPGSRGSLNLLYNVVKKGIPWLLGDLENRHSSTSTDNLCYVIEGLLTKKISMGIYHMGDDGTLSTDELIAIMCEAIGKQLHIWKMNKGFMEGCAGLEALLHLPLNTERLRRLTENYVVINTKIKATLGIDKMLVTAKEGLTKTIRSFEETKQVIYYLIILVLLFLVEPFYFRIVDKRNIIGKPSERSSHTRTTLRGGGIILFFGALAYSLTNQFEYPWFMLALTLITFISFADDTRSTSQGLRLMSHFTAMALMFYQWGLLGLPWWTIAVALIVYTGIINAYNFMDGTNGITDGYLLVVLTVLALINGVCVPFVEPALIYTMFRTMLVFNFFNFRKQVKCFAGDVGSVSITLVILFLIGTLITHTENFSWIVLLVPRGVDNVLIIIHRLMLYKNTGLSHRKHLYQIMASELKIPHVVVLLVYMLVQTVVVAGYLLFPGNEYGYSSGTIIALSLVYILFIKRFFCLHRTK